MGEVNVDSKPGVISVNNSHLSDQGQTYTLLSTGRTGWAGQHGQFTTRMTISPQKLYLQIVYQVIYAGDSPQSGPFTISYCYISIPANYTLSRCWVDAVACRSTPTRLYTKKLKPIVLGEVFGQDETVTLHGWDSTTISLRLETDQNSGIFCLELSKSHVATKCCHMASTATLWLADDIIRE